MSPRPRRRPRPESRYEGCRWSRVPAARRGERPAPSRPRAWQRSDPKPPGGQPAAGAAPSRDRRPEVPRGRRADSEPTRVAARSPHPRARRQAVTCKHPWNHVHGDIDDQEAEGPGDAGQSSEQGNSQYGRVKGPREVAILQGGKKHQPHSPRRSASRRTSDNGPHVY